MRHNDVAAGWRQDYLLASDVHLDNPHCDRRLFRRHLDEAQQRGAGVLIFGDLLDGMGGRNDPRRSKGEIRPALNRDDYWDRVIDEAAEMLEPYRAQLVMIADGNHETATRRNIETDLLARLGRALNVPHMGYSGFVRFMFAAPGNGGQRATKRLYWHHGSGGGGPVTKGVIQTNRRAASVDADIFVSGHIHEAWQVENVVVKMLDSGRIVHHTQYHCQLATYKQEYVLSGGYHIEKGRPPKPLGAWWLSFVWQLGEPGNVKVRFERAD